MTSGLKEQTFFQPFFYTREAIGPYDSIQRLRTWYDQIPQEHWCLMTIHKKILLLLLISVTLYTGLVTFFQHYLILPSFLSLEADEARKDMDRCIGALEREVHHLDIFCFDWSAWDDTYEFMQSNTEDYIASNLSSASFLENDLNLMAFYNADGGVVWSTFYDLESEEQVEFPDASSEAWLDSFNLRFREERNDAQKGLVQTSLGSMLLSSRAILPSEPSDGEVSRGTMLMGRLLNEDMLGKIRDDTQVDLEIYANGDEAIPVNADTQLSGEYEISYGGETSLHVVSYIYDLEGEPALAFVATIPRDILSRGKEAIGLQIVAAAAAGIVFLLSLGVFMRALVSSPLRQLADHVRALRPGTAQGVVHESGRRDEIGQLEREFGETLQHLHREEREREGVERALRDSQIRMETILRTAPDAIVVTNDQGVIESVNNAAIALFDGAVEALVGLSGCDLLPDKEQVFWQELLSASENYPSDETTVIDRESMVRGRSGMVRPAHVRVSSVMLEGEIRLIWSVRDISGLKALQAEIEKARHLAKIGEMGAVVAHDIRNPLTGIHGAVHFLRGSDLTPLQREEGLTEIVQASDRIGRTVDQMLILTKPLSVSRSSFHLLPLLEAIFGSGANGMESSVRIICARDLRISADPNLLCEVLVHLWSNACQSAGESGEYTIAAWSSDENLYISVADNGPGVDDAVRSQLFEPFFTTRVNGAGLGLPVSLRIMESHGGSIEIGENDPVGTIVTIALPGGVV
jgi:PAS domain S-box-containing protein